MKVIGSSISWSSQHHLAREEQHTRIARERAVHRSGPEMAPAGAARRQPTVSLPSAAATPAPSPPPKSTEDQVAALDADVMRLKALVETLIGRKIEDPICIDENPRSCEPAATTAPPQRAAAAEAAENIEYETTIFSHHYISEQEYSAVSVGGTFVVADDEGTDSYLSIELHVSMARYYEASSSELTVRQGRLSDPLVVNLTSLPASLSSTTTLFDLDGDGTEETLPSLSAGSAYLAWDANGDGSIGSGKELFGPSTGNGFAELARFDEDGNGFIDAGDTLFSQLQLYRPSDNFQQSLASTAIGAIHTGSVDSPFRLTDSDNNTLGQVRSTGFYLNEDGSAGSVQQIDLKV